jgi:uncharacterized alkaline shock family protein YloU
MTPPNALRVPQAVVVDVAATAARGVPGVTRLGRGGRGLAGLVGRSPVEVRLEAGEAWLRVRVVAGSSVRFDTLAEAVRHAVAAAVERQLGLGVREVTVVVAGLGG